jgi:uncharacterized membrane protein YqjE
MYKFPEWQPFRPKWNPDWIGGVIAMADVHHVEPPVDEKDSVGSLVTEIKKELVEFVRTRLLLLVSELREKVGTSKKAVAFAATALIFGGVGFLLLTLAAVGLVAVAFWGSPFAFFWGFLIIGIFYVLLAGIGGIAAYSVCRNLVPRKTIKVLHDDKDWVQSNVEAVVRRESIS